MGKRELLLIVGFVFVGAVVYQFAAPAGPAREGFSFSKLLDHLRREVRENSAEAEHSSETVIGLNKGVTELRVGALAQIKVVGEAREDIAAGLRVHSTGSDEEEARDLARRTTLQVNQTGSVMAVTVDYPVEGRQRGELTLRIPRRLTVRLRETRGGAELRDIGGLFLDDTRGEIVLGTVNGELRGTFQGGRLRADAIGAVHLTTRRGEIEIDKVKGDATLDLSGGSLRVNAIGGKLDLNANRVEVEIDEVGGEVRANASEGSLELGGLRRETRIDGRGTEISVALAAALPLTAITNEETLEVRLPATSGVTIDATASNGEIRVPDTLTDALPVEKHDDEQRARGAVRGGGPELSLRVTRGDIIIR
jgi:DUF4097 and DUF4098 domain-containing protein YvlB